MATFEPELDRVGTKRGKRLYAVGVLHREADKSHQVYPMPVFLDDAMQHLKNWFLTNIKPGDVLVFEGQTYQSFDDAWTSVVRTAQR